MSIAKVRIHNTQEFLDDLKKVAQVMVIAPKSNAYLGVTKSAVMKEAEEEQIFYYISTKIYKVERPVMVIM